MLFGYFAGDVIAVLFFAAGISLAWWVFGRRSVRKTASKVLGGISVTLLLLIPVLYFVVRFLAPAFGPRH
jgi:hypothetical protein